jgi:hypothetical protein
LGICIGCLKSNSDEARAVFTDMKVLRKRKEVTIGDARYRLTFSEHESFGETLYRIQMKEVKPTVKSLRLPNAR